MRTPGREQSLVTTAGWTAAHAKVGWRRRSCWEVKGNEVGSVVVGERRFVMQLRQNRLDRVEELEPGRPVARCACHLQRH